VTGRKTSWKPQIAATQKATDLTAIQTPEPTHNDAAAQAALPKISLSFSSVSPGEVTGRKVQLASASDELTSEVFRKCPHFR